ncbi:MAG: DNA polymerase II [Gemmatimonadetes bacterium]|nr:DNA polymerase II [Gemmatimonadota bacterium]
MTDHGRDAELSASATRAAEWLAGWDPTPGIVSVWAERSGLAHLWRRDPTTGVLRHEVDRFRPWVVLDRLDDLDRAGVRPDPLDSQASVSVRTLEGPGALRYLVSASDGKHLVQGLLRGASQRLGRTVEHLRELGSASVLALPPEEQYLVATGRTYFRDLPFDCLRRLQFDLETTGLDADRARIFLVAVGLPSGETVVLEAKDSSDRAEADLIGRLVETIVAADPDVIENHNLHGFDLPFLARRARRLGVGLPLGRLPSLGVRHRAARRGRSDRRAVRLIIPGRELIDTLDAVRRYDFATRELPGHGLKAVAKHLGLAKPDRQYLKGDEIYSTYRSDPDRVRRYATGDVEEVAALARILGGAAFALAQMAPRRYERLADAGAATGVIDPMLVRAYLRSGAALPAHEPGDGTAHTGAALHLFAAGVAHRVVKADVASLYPSLMRSFRIGPARDRLGVLLALVDGWVERRLEAKARAKEAPAGSRERHGHEAMSAALKLVVNTAYGYLAAGGELTRFADVHAANEVTRRGRETLALMCQGLESRGVTLLEADTDGVYFAVPADWTEADERRVVDDVAALLPEKVQLELEGRYPAMLSHEPKNYALLREDGTVLLRGVAFRSSRAEPFGERFLRQAIAQLLGGDLPAVRACFLETVEAIRRRTFATHEMSSRVRLTKGPAKYQATRATRRELPYEAMLAAGRTTWRVGDRIRVYRTRHGARLAPENERDDPRDYDVDHYVAALNENYLSRLTKAFRPADFLALFTDPDQPSLFAVPLEAIRPILTSLGRAASTNPVTSSSRPR